MKQKQGLTLDHPSPKRDLTALFCPRSIAVVGASRKEGSVGHALVRNLIYGGYTGVIYPVNPKAKGIQSIPCFPDMKSIGDAPELGVVVVPANYVETVGLQAAGMGTRH
ncbi:MAG: CoA-binding protein, partial [Pirellulaceae bacterium]